MSGTANNGGELAASTVLTLKPRPDFIETPRVRDLLGRGLNYLRAGFAVHLRGPAGTGKTTLALHLAAQLGRPVMLVVGDEEMSTSDLVGGQYGYQYRKVVDRFIHSVLKYEENATQRWADRRLTTACRDGLTLVYDEFTRSHAEANNVLLGVLEERLLVLPGSNREAEYVRVHPDFHAIFTSNPQEYAGVHEAQDALSDRMVTIDVDHLDRDSEVAIAVARSGLGGRDAGRIIDLVRDYRASGEYSQAPTLRAGLMIARVVSLQGLPVSADDSRFVQTCLDVLEAKSAPASRSLERRQEHRRMLLRLIEHHCSGADDHRQPDLPQPQEEQPWSAA